MGFQPYGSFPGRNPISNSFQTLNVDTLYLSREMLLLDNAVIRSHNFESGVAGFILRQDGTVEMNSLVLTGDLQSSNYVAGTSGYFLDYSTGAAEFNSITVNGDIESSNYVAATSGYFLDYSTGSAEFNDITAYGVISTAQTGPRIELGSGSGFGYIDFYAATGGLRGYIYANSGGDLQIYGSSRHLILDAQDDMQLNAVNNLEINIGIGSIIQANDGSGSGNNEIYPKGTLIVMDSHTDTTDYTNVPAANTITHTKTVSCEYANQPVYVDATIKVRWKGMTIGSYVYCRPSINGAGQGLVCIDQPDTNSVGYLTQNARIAVAATANGSGNIVLGTECRSASAAADVEEIQIDYVIWRR